MSKADLARLWEASWEDITEQQPLETKRPIEKINLNEAYVQEGVCFLKAGPIVQELKKYDEARSRMLEGRIGTSNYLNGWSHPTPYIECREILDVGLDPSLTSPISFLLSDAPLLHLALTGYVSTERNWHQDSYLNPPDVWSNYVAAWIAIDDIDEDSGPFEFVQGSHKWPTIRREKVFALLPEHVRHDPSWPSITQEALAAICERKIKEENADVIRYTPKKGEILLWHSNLIHRGTEPKNKDLLRKALILHYSGLTSRPDMKKTVRYKSGWYFDPR